MKASTVKRGLAAALAISVFATAGSPATAAQPREQFVDFGDQLIEGVRRGPAGLWVLDDAGPGFDRLVHLKRSFVRELLATAKHPALR